MVFDVDDNQKIYQMGSIKLLFEVFKMCLHGPNQGQNHAESAVHWVLGKILDVPTSQDLFVLNSGCQVSLTLSDLHV